MRFHNNFQSILFPRRIYEEIQFFLAFNKLEFLHKYFETKGMNHKLSKIYPNFSSFYKKRTTFPITKHPFKKKNDKKKKKKQYRIPHNLCPEAVLLKLDIYNSIHLEK